MYEDHPRRCRLIAALTMAGGLPVQAQITSQTKVSTDTSVDNGVATRKAGRETSTNSNGDSSTTDAVRIRSAAGRGSAGRRRL